MAALAAAAVKNQRKKQQQIANKSQEINGLTDQRIALNHVVIKHRDSLSSVSTLDSLRHEVKKQHIQKVITAH